MTRLRLFASILCILWPLLAACAAPPPKPTSQPANTQVPGISNVVFSSTYMARSDCSPSMLTITATLANAADVAGVTLKYRVGNQQPFGSAAMRAGLQGEYVSQIKGEDIPGSEYGDMSFQFDIQDKTGQTHASQLYKGVALQPCVGR